MQTVTSKDGTVMAYEAAGWWPRAAATRPSRSS